MDVESIEVSNELASRDERGELSGGERDDAEDTRG